MRDRAFYEPVSALDDLAQLEKRWLRGLVGLRRLALGATALSLLLIALNLAGTAFDTTASLSRRTWSVFPVLSFALVLAPLAARNVWLRRRALAAQRRLLGHRGLLGRESEVRAAEERIASLLASQSPAEPGVSAAFEAARRSSRDRLEELALVGLARPGKQADEERESTERRIPILLDGYTHVLETIAVEATLDPSRLGSVETRLALERAKRLLAPDAEVDSIVPSRSNQGDREESVTGSARKR